MPTGFLRLGKALLPASVKLTIVLILRATLVVFEHLSTREMLIGTYGTQRLQGPSVHDGLYSSISPSLNHVGATVRDIGLGYPHRPYIWPIDDDQGGSP